MEMVLKKANFPLFFKHLKKDYAFIGPLRKGGATSTYTYTTFDYVDRMEDLEIDYESSMLSPKRLYFPDSQELYDYEKNDQGIRLRDLLEVWDKKRVIFGLRPCDIEAILRLDKVFLENSFVDQYYQDKRRNSIIIGMTCGEARPYCFCNAVGSGQYIESGYDLLMTDIGESYFVRSRTELGQELITTDIFTVATKRDGELREMALQKIKKSMPDKIDMEKISSVLADKYNDEIWREFSSNCFTCGSCNMVCPTCHCFTITDKTSPDKSGGTRVLVWDSCHFERFARIAGNVTIRGDKNSRFKHRLYDKYYYNVRQHGLVACVGCGRCIEFCPSNIDLRVALRRVQEG